MTDLARKLRRLLLTLPRTSEGPSRFGDGSHRAYAVGGREFAHFHGPGAIDVRLTRAGVRSLALEDRRLAFRPSASDWVEVRFRCMADVSEAFRLARMAHDAARGRRLTLPRSPRRMKKMADTSIETGKKAPAFSLPDQDGKKATLASLAGKWIVLYFYPKDDTPGCTVEACQFTEGLRGFEKLDAVVLGCSPDAPESHRRFIAKHKLRVGLLSDPEHRTMEAYGAWGEKVLYGKKSVGVIRSTVLIDPAGKVAHHWRKAKADGHAASVRAKLEELRG